MSEPVTTCEEVMTTQGTNERSPEDVQRTLDLLGIRPEHSAYEDCKELAKMFVAWQIADMFKIEKAGLNV